MKKLRKLFINIKNKFTLIKLGVHFSRYALFESYRRNNSLIDLSPRHYYSYSKSMIIVFKWILNKYIKYLESNNIIISVNNIVAIGHLYPEIDLLLRELKENKDLQNKIIWFTAPKSKLLIQSKKIFERDNLVIKISGIVHLISTLAMKMRPDLSICVAQSSLNIIKGEKNVSVHEVFQWRQLNRAKKLRENKNEFPLRKYGEIFNSSEIFEKLNILKPYVVVQIKDKAINGTFKPVDPDTYLGAIKY